jgi:hypothetical protein
MADLTLISSNLLLPAEWLFHATGPVSITPSEISWESIMEPPAASGSPLSVHRAFVVQFRVETDGGAGVPWFASSM